MAPGEPRSHPRSGPGALYRGAGRDGRRLAGAAAHPRSYSGLDVAAGPPGRPAPLLLAGDLTYGADILQRGQLPGVGNRRRLAESSHKILALAEQQPGLVVLPAHDPTAAQRLLDN